MGRCHSSGGLLDTAWAFITLALFVCLYATEMLVLASVERLGRFTNDFDLCVGV